MSTMDRRAFFKFTAGGVAAASTLGATSIIKTALPTVIEAPGARVMGSADIFGIPKHILDGLRVGMGVTGPGLPPSAKIVRVDIDSVTLNCCATASVGILDHAAPA